MKPIYFFILLFFCAFGFSQKINWMTLNQALEAQKKNPKKILLNIQTPWCDTCRDMDNQTLSNKDVASYINSKFYPVKFNGEGDEVVYFQNKVFKNDSYDPSKKNERNSPHTLTMALGIRAYPTILILDENGTPTFPIEGLNTIGEFEAKLKFIGENIYLTARTRDALNQYMKTFKGSFRG